MVSVRQHASVDASLRCALDRIPAFAGNADFVRFRSGRCNINGVILGLVPRISVACFEGIDAESPRCANRDSRDEPENDSEGGVGPLR